MRNWYTLYKKILFTYFSDKYLLLPENVKQSFSPKNPWMRLLQLAGYFVVRLLGNLFKTVGNGEQLQGKVWLYVVSQNNYDSLKFMADGLPGAVFVAGQSKNIGRYNRSVYRISLRSKIKYYYKFFPLLFLFLKYKKQSTCRFFDLIFNAVGFYEVYRRKLQQYKPAALVFANDHTPDARAMLFAAKAQGIPTIYIQHASVSNSFPPLEHDLNLLEGQDALDKYKQCGPLKGEVRFIGMPKADAYIQTRKTATPVRHIGICCNTIDSTKGIGEVAQLLTQEFPELQLTLRPHPRDTRNFSFLKQLNPNLAFSNAASESAFDFLLQQDLIIAGDSSIHLEAVLLNIPGIYYKFDAGATLNDYYGYARHGLVERADTATDLIRQTKLYTEKRPDVYLKAAYYNATVGTEYEGNSSALAINYIRAFLNKKE